jgi:hypothetical protein
MLRHDFTHAYRVPLILTLLGLPCTSAALFAEESPRLDTSPSASSSDDTGLNLAPARIDLQPQPGTASPPKSEPPPADSAKLNQPDRVFGHSGTTWATLGGGVAYNGKDSDENIFVTYEYFIANDVEVFGELGAWQYSQEGPDSTGFNISMVVRWHFIDTGKWTVFGDLGIGVLFATDPVPRRDGVTGTNFDFTPRAGGGFTRQLSDDGVRLEVGFRWAHVSNARISGNNDNPGRDSAMLYAGLIFPF